MNWTPAAIAAGSPAARATASSVWMFASPSGSNRIMSSIVTTCDRGARPAPTVITGAATLFAPFGPVAGHTGHPAPRQQAAAVVSRSQLHDHEEAPALLELVLDAPGHENLRADDGQVHDLQPLTGVDGLSDIEPLFSQANPVAGQYAYRRESFAAGCGEGGLVRSLQVSFDQPFGKLVLNAPQVYADGKLVEGHVGPFSLFVRHGLPPSRPASADYTASDGSARQCQISRYRPPQTSWCAYSPISTRFCPRDIGTPGCWYPSASTTTTRQPTLSVPVASSLTSWGRRSFSRMHGWSCIDVGHDATPSFHAATIMFCAARPASKSLPEGAAQTAMPAAAPSSGCENVPHSAISFSQSRSRITTSRMGCVFFELPAMRPACTMRPSTSSGIGSSV